MHNFTLNHINIVTPQLFGLEPDTCKVNVMCSVVVFFIMRCFYVTLKLM